MAPLALCVCSPVTPFSTRRKMRLYSYIWTFVHSVSNNKIQLTQIIYITAIYQLLWRHNQYLPVSPQDPPTSILVIGRSLISPSLISAHKRSVGAFLALHFERVCFTQRTNLNFIEQAFQFTKLNPYYSNNYFK